MNDYLYIAAGTSWFVGFYLIASVAGGAATLTPIQSGGLVGCGSSTNLSSGSASIDRTARDAAYKSGTNLTVDHTTNTDVAPDGYTPSQADVGGFIQITTTGGGAAFTIGFYPITQIVGGKWRLLTSPAAVDSLGATWAFGGAHSDPALIAAQMVAGNDLWLKGSFTVTSASSNVAGGCVSLPAGSAAANATKMIGYGTIRGDGTQATLTASGINTFTLVTLAAKTYAEAIAVNGGSFTSSRGFNVVSNSGVYRCKASSCTNSGFAGATTSFGVLCEATGCATAPAYGGGGWDFCTAHDNTISGFNSTNSGCTLVGCISCNNSGAGSDGFGISANVTLVNCAAYNNGRDGFRCTASGTNEFTFVNCLSVGHIAATAYGFNASAADDGVRLINCAAQGNTTGDWNTAVITPSNVVGFLSLTVSPFVAPGSNNFALNLTNGGGALLRAAGIPAPGGITSLPGLSTPSYQEVGAASLPAQGGGPFGRFRKLIGSN